MNGNESNIAEVKVGDANQFIASIPTGTNAAINHPTPTVNQRSSVVFVQHSGSALAAFARGGFCAAVLLYAVDRIKTQEQEFGPTLIISLRGFANATLVFVRTQRVGNADWPPAAPNLNLRGN